MDLLAWSMSALAIFGSLATIAGALAVRRFAARPPRPARHRPPVTILKPLYGDEPRLEEALASVCGQAYPKFQIVFGVQDPADPALGVVERLRARFPALDIVVAIDPSVHGPNRKICNLINMLPLARHETLVFSDSDLHVAPDYVERLVASLEAPGTGLVTTLCAGLPTAPGLGARLGAAQITYGFLPGVLLGRALGRQDCLGTTMALRRATLDQVGGLHGLVTHLAEDNVLGQRIRALGLTIALADTVPCTAVADPSLRALWQHEMRWARTIGGLEPFCFAASALQFPLFWGAVALAGGTGWNFAFFALAWAIRAAAARGSNRALHPGRRELAAPFWLLPVRDVLSVVEIATSYFGRRVVWRGHAMRAGRMPLGAPESWTAPAPANIARR